MVSVSFRLALRVFGCGLLLFICSLDSTFAQRQMERLGRGVVALHSSGAQAYIGWRLFATDPSDIGFNVYRSANGAAGVKLNTSVITNTTDFLDTTANFTISNAWYVVPVIGGIEQTPSAPYGLAANSAVRQYVPLALQPVAGGPSPPYDVKFSWVGDFDGDGEYDYLVDRLTASGTNALNQYLQAYKRDGTLLWQMDMGYNSTNQYNIEPGASAISIGHGDNVTVYDLDGDGKAEVCVRTARGVVLPDSTIITGPDDTTQYLSILNGLTGAELARATITNMWPGDGPMSGHFGIMYCDGVHPSVLLHIENRNSSDAFQRETMAYDFRNGQLSRRWFFTPPAGANLSWGHQIRIMDVNHDGIDDLVEVGSARSGANGQTLYDTELVHGDRFHITDIDPDRPGLEMFSIQQNNPTLLATALIDMGTGALIKKWYSSGIVDVGRGIALDLDGSRRGLEMYSTQPGIFDCKGNQVFVNNVWPPEALWWDADLTREFEDGAGSGALNPVVNKFNQGTGNSDRIYTLYNEDGGVHQAYGGRAAVWGDLFGDWREEFMVVADDYNSVRIYSTKILATNRLYCLMQNPAYRCQMTCRGYYQASYVDYFLGNGMPVPPLPPVSDAQLVWRGNAGNVWDENTTANWFTNNLWISNTTPAVFSSAASVLFDLSGSNNSAITLNGAIAPASVTVHSPKSYTFDSSAGELTGPMKLTKAGAGKLTSNGTNTYSGNTLVAEGSFIVNGALPNSPVTVRGGVWLDGRLGGNGVVGSGVRIEEGAGVSPGNGTNSPGTLIIANNLTLTGRTLNDFDLSDNPGGTNDLLVVSDNLTLQGTNTFVIRKLNATLPPGVYPLMNYSGALSGNLNNLTVTGLPGIPVALTNPPGQISLVVKSYRSPATISWTGGSGGNAWDLLVTSNWFNAGVKDIFAPNDNVRFDSIGVSNLTVNLVGNLNAASVVVDSSANYTLTGSGGIIGGASLTKSNTGTLTLSALNSTFFGKTTIAGGTMVVAELDAIGFASPLGNPPGGSTNLVLSGSSTLRITGESYTDRGLTLNAGTNTLEVLNTADQVTIAGQIVGSGALRKNGGGTLALNVANTYSGGTIISAGTIALGSTAGNQTGVGTGAVIFTNGTLSMINIQASETAAWPIIVPAGCAGRLDADGRCTLTGSLTGGGTFTVMTPYVRTDFSGNWSAFTGQLNFITDSDGGDFRCNNANGYPNAKINLASLVSLQNRLGSTPTIFIGELSGAAGCNASASGGNSGLPVTWSVGSLNTSATFAGNTYNNIGFVKVGTGTWTWSGTNLAHSGATTVNGGTLLINGNAAGAGGNVIVGATGTLGGTGTIGGATTVSGKISPGTSIGTLTINNNVTLNSGSTTLIEINKTAGTRDLLDASATLTYGGTLQVTNLSGALALNDSFKIFDAATYVGGFGSFILPPLGGSLAWNTASLVTNGTISIINSGMLPPSPAAPTNLVATAIGYSQINLTWSDVSTNEDNFLIERSSDGVSFSQIVSVGAGVTGYSSVGLNASTLYYYRVRASNSGGNSAYANVASATTLAAPAGLVWRGDGAGNAWDVNATANWRSNGVASVFTDGLAAIFDDSGSNNVAVSLSGLISPSSVTVSAAKNYTFAGSGSLNNAMPMIKTGSGTLTISSAQAYSGGTFVGGGTFALTSNGSPGSGSITFSNGTTFVLSGSSVFEGAPVSVVAGATVTMNSGSLANGYSGSISSADDQGTFIIAGPVSMDGQNLKQFQGFTGTVQINSGAQLRFSKTSGVNNGGDFTKFVVSGTLNTRNGGAVACGSLDGNSTGLLSGGGSGAGTTAFTIGLLGVDSTYYGTIADANATGVTSLTKVGAGILTLAGSNTYSLTTTISGGTLQIGDGGGTGALPTNNIVNNATLAFNRANAISDSGGVISGTGAVVQDGDGTVTLAKSHTHSGPTLINSGTLALSGAGSISNSTAINIASGATFDVSARTGGGMTLTSGKTLSGNGSVNGNFTLASGAKLTPGNSLGTLTFSNNLTLSAGSTTMMEVSRPPVANDKLKVLGTLGCGGSLIVTNTGGNAPAAGDSFRLFDAAVMTGGFSSVMLPALTGNLKWSTNNLMVDGTITVIAPAPPVFESIARLGDGTVRLTFSGSAGWGYEVRASTNVALVPLTNWPLLISGTFTGPVVTLDDLAATNHSQRFYLIRVP